MSKDSMYRLVDECIENNILVYDRNADVGTLTRRLMYMIKVHQPYATDIIVSKDVYIEFVPDDWDGRYCTLFGIGVELSGSCSSVNEAKDLQDYYEKRGCTLASGDTNLVLAYHHRWGKEDEPKHVYELPLVGSC